VLEVSDSSASGVAAVPKGEVQTEMQRIVEIPGRHRELPRNQAKMCLTLRIPTFFGEVIYII